MHQLQCSARLMHAAMRETIQKDGRTPEGWSALPKEALLKQIRKHLDRAEETAIFDETKFQRSLVHIMNYAMFMLDNDGAFEPLDSNTIAGDALFGR